VPKPKPDSDTTTNSLVSVDDYVRGVLSGDRAKLARAITLVESRKTEHQTLAQAILLKLMPHTGLARRVGISGVPGAGKSTFINTIGVKLTTAGHKVAVLAVDPSSSRSGGSILGDKTRMAHLAVEDNAFIRPSPTAGTLGGVARTTRETILVCEAAGYDVILVETVGVGQSEIAVSEMVDFFVVLLIAGGGDELQGIKKGVLELADLIAINKADGANDVAAKRAAAACQNALRIITPASPTWAPPVLTISAQENIGLDTLWDKVEQHHSLLNETGELLMKRQHQMVGWMWAMVSDRLMGRFKTDQKVKKLLPDLEGAIANGELTPVLALDRLLTAFDRGI